MTDIDQTVDFLHTHDALRLGESPWETYTDGDEVHSVDWDRLFQDDKQQAGALVDDPNDGPWRGVPPDIVERFSASIAEIAPVRQPSTGQNRCDHCAWYQPVHYHGHDWGIFIREEQLLQKAMEIYPFVDASYKASKSRAFIVDALVRAATYLFFLHEHFHHKVECLCLRLHVITGVSAYLPYMDKVYGTARGKDDLIEEALANADIFRRMSTEPYRTRITPPVVKATKQYLRVTFPNEPPGYRRAVDFLTSGTFAAGENRLQGQVRECTLNPTQPPDEWDLAPRLMQSFLNVKSRIWSIVPAGRDSFLPTRVIPVPTCSTKEMIQLFDRGGYAVVRGGKGSHVKLQKRGAATMILPGDRSQLSPGVASTALKLLGKFRLTDLPKLVSGRTAVGG